MQRDALHIASASAAVAAADSIAVRVKAVVAVVEVVGPGLAVELIIDSIDYSVLA